MTESIEVLVGRIGKPHGLRGHVTVDVRTDEPERRFVQGAKLKAEAPKGSAFAPRQLTVEALRWHGGVLQLQFAEVPDRTAAEAARGVLLYADIPADATPEDPDEFYDHQLVGLAAYDTQGAHLGEVTGLVHGGAQDLLELRTTEALGRRNVLIPFVKALVPTVDLAAARVEIADRPGLVRPLPEDDADEAEEQQP
ncbi:ribosome maturation factor RimM [Nocardioides sp. Kera G14]|uniref:ribosome maturation factor RimM n=1 Tax=Nocardioides sp. Kera G14 TaxID=2884264 RepID=UPI001D11515C|nr:ribosome maturation factor RimM [Nocardioides sp. Kera G14]UDY22648.1 ribosome maturation factor RimM [Nocardioides sp. Kera G14]